MDLKSKVKDRSMLKKAFGLGFTGIFAYLVSYYSRNLLSVASPNMLLSGEYTEEFIAILSSTYFFVYAAGQLVNGLIGDAVPTKYMISIGLTVTGTVLILFPIVPFAWMQILCFALMGVGLSMLRGPIVKMVAENLSKDYSRVISTCLLAVSFLGPLIASGFAIVFRWRIMFIVAGVIAIAIALISFVSLTAFERKGQLVFHSNRSSGFAGYLEVFKIEKIVFFLILGGIMEMGSTAIGFWVPTYLATVLKLNKVTTNTIYSIMSIAISLAPFFMLFLYKFVKMKQKDVFMMRAGTLLSVILFLFMIIIPNMWAKVVLLVLAEASLSCCTAVLWSIYIPGLGSTGKVSSINGVMNCNGYLSAAIANVAFGKLLEINWNYVIFVWCGLAVIGLVASVFVNKKQKIKNYK